jgi:hypothetical protein
LRGAKRVSENFIRAGVVFEISSSLSARVNARTFPFRRRCEFGSLSKKKKRAAQRKRERERDKRRRRNAKGPHTRKKRTMKTHLDAFARTVWTGGSSSVHFRARRDSEVFLIIFFP